MHSCMKALSFYARKDHSTVSHVMRSEEERQRPYIVIEDQDRPTNRPTDYGGKPGSLAGRQIFPTTILAQRQMAIQLIAQNFNARYCQWGPVVLLGRLVERGTRTKVTSTAVKKGLFTFVPDLSHCLWGRGICYLT